MTRNSALLSGILLSAVGAAEAQPLNTTAGAGKDIYETNCATCHGLDGRGGGPASNYLSVKPADLTQIAKRRKGKFPDDEIMAKIDGREEIGGHGSRDMPVWGRIFSNRVGDGAIGEEVTQGNLKALVEYLRTLQNEQIERIDFPNENIR